MSKHTKVAAVPREQEWLNGAERARLAELERVIDTGARMFVQMGRALGEVRDARLYREAHGTFEAYCSAKWGLSRRRAYDLMEAAGVVDALCANGAHDAPAPASERVARELVPLRDEPEAMADAMSHAVEQHGPSPTAAQVREVVRGPAPEPPGGDIRWSHIENAIDRMRDMPSLGAFPLPTEPGDIEAMDAAVKWMDEWWPQFKRTWRDHKRFMRGMKAVN